MSCRQNQLLMLVAFGGSLSLCSALLCFVQINTK